MTLPDYQTLMLPVLELAAQGEQSVPGMEAAIAARFHLTDEERQAMLPSGRQRVLHNRTHWAKFYLTKAGLVQSTRRGYVRITPAGRRFSTRSPSKSTGIFFCKKRASRSGTQARPGLRKFPTLPRAP